MNYPYMIERAITVALAIIMMMAIESIAIAQPVISEHDTPSLSSLLTSDAGTWDDRFAIDIDGEIRAMVAYHGELYITGRFTQVNRVRTTNFAHWDGTAWHSMSNDSLVGDISAMAVDSSGNLYVCRANSSTPVISQVWMYNRASGIWSRLGADIPGLVTEAECSDSTLYIGGRLTRDNDTSYYTIAAWDGTSWKPMDNGLRSHNQAQASSLLWNGEQLIAGGWFYVDGPDTLAQAVQWNGQRWQALGKALPGAPLYYRLTQCKGTLIATYNRGRTLDTLTLTYVDHLTIVAYDTLGHQWTILDSTFNGRLFSMIASEDRLYLGCNSIRGDTTIRGVAIFDPSSHRWSQFGGNITDTWVRALAMLPEGLVIGCGFNQPGSNIIPYLARWDGSEWAPFIASGADGLNSIVSQLTVRRQDIYALGSFKRAGNIPADGIARWDGSQWHNVPEIESRVQAIGSDSTGIYAGIRASYDTLDVLWNNDSSWSSLRLKAGGTIAAIAPHGNNLYIGGRFRQFNDSVANDPSHYAVAHFDHLTGEWSWLESSISGKETPQVYAVAVFGRNVVVGGNFDSINGIAAKNVARWDGTRWHPIGDGFSSRVLSLTFTPNGELYAGGEFLTSGSRQIAFLASSNGNDWDAVSGSPDWPVQAIASTDDGLYIGGESFGLMRLDLKTGAWSKPGGGISSIGPSAAIVRAIALDGDELYVGGSFSMAGDKLSYCFAHWSPKTSSVGMATTPAAAASFTGIMPNPTQDAASITFTLPRDGNATLAIYSPLGTETSVVASRHFTAGEHALHWNPGSLPNGIYYCQLRFEGSVTTQQVVLLR